MPASNNNATYLRAFGKCTDVVFISTITYYNYITVLAVPIVCKLDLFYVTLDDYYFYFGKINVNIFIHICYSFFTDTPDSGEVIFTAVLPNLRLYF